MRRSLEGAERVDGQARSAAFGEHYAVVAEPQPPQAILRSPDSERRAIAEDAAAWDAVYGHIGHTAVEVHLRHEVDPGADEIEASARAVVLGVVDVRVVLPVRPCVRVH